MPYRRLPEMGRARDQLDLMTARRLRALERRSRYPGSRGIAEADTITVATNQTVGVLSLFVDRGSWIVDAGCNIVYASTGTYEAATLTLVPYAPKTEEQYEESVGPPAMFAMPFASGSVVTIPLTVFGHGAWSDPTRLDLEVTLASTPSTHDVEIVHLCIQATPI
jgi:hypothetical protein